MTLTSLAINVLALLVGFTLGLLVQWRQQELKGKVRLIPTFVFTGKRIDLVLALGVVLAIGVTVLISIGAAERNRECNAVLREALDNRVYSSENSRDANTLLITELIVEGPTTREQREEVVDRYRATQAQIDQYLEDHPIPPPAPGCGL